MVHRSTGGTWLRSSDPTDLVKTDSRKATLDVGKLIFGKNLLAVFGHCPSLVVGDGPRDDAHPEIEETGLLAGLCETDRTDAGPSELDAVEILVYLST